MAIPKIKLAGGGERAQYLLRDYNDNTIRFVLNYPGLVDPDILRKAVKAVVESVDVLHGTFFSDGTMAYWHINEDVGETHYFHYIETEGDPIKTANSLSLLPVYPDNKVQMHVTLVQSDSASCMVIRLSHLVVDGSDGKYLLTKLVNTYNIILDTGSVASVAVKDGSRAPEKVYEKLELQDMKELLTNPLSSVETAYPYSTQNSGMPRVTVQVIPAETMSVARRKAKALGSTVNDLLITAFFRAYAAMDSVDACAPMSISSMMDLRRHCKSGESEGLCNMSGAFSTTLENGCTGTFAQTLEEITRQTIAVKEDPYAGLAGMPIMHSMTRTIPIWLLQIAVGKVYGKLSLGMTNLGNLNCSELAMGGLIPSGGLFGGPLKKKPGMQISVMSFDGECVLTVVGVYSKEDAVVLKGTLDKMADEISVFAFDK